MYKSKYDAEVRDEVNFFKKNLIWIVLFMVLVSGGAWFVNRAVQVGETAVVKYEEFQEIYNACQKIDADLATIRGIPDNDKMFDNISKQAMIANKRQQLTRWTEEYNAKSKVWTRSLWKSSSLPYQLSVNQFPNYER